MSDVNLAWHDAQAIGIEGKGWSDTGRYYDRLPARAQAVVTEAVWNLSHCAVGLCVHFETDASAIQARWTLRDPVAITRPMNTLLHHCGLDLYGQLDGRWQWVQVATPPVDSDSRTVTAQFGNGKMRPGRRRYCCYLPLVNPVENLEIGVPVGAAFEGIPPRTQTEKPIAYYGTSIVHGYDVSRPGMAHCALLGRRLDRPMLNLGFAGNAKMEAPLAELFAELAPCLWLIDPVPNMNADFDAKAGRHAATMIEERAEKFLRILHEAHLDTPIVMIEDRIHSHAAFFPEVARMHEANRAAWRKVYDDLRGDGWNNLHYLGHEAFRGLGEDGDGTSDGSHPSDLGAWRYTQAIEPVVRSILDES